MEFNTWLIIVSISSLIAIYLRHNKDNSRLAKSEAPLETIVGLTPVSVFFFDAPHWQQFIYLAAVLVAAIAINSIVEYRLKQNQTYQINVYRLCSSLFVFGLIAFFINAPETNLPTQALTPNTSTINDDQLFTPSMTIMEITFSYLFVFLVNVIITSIQSPRFDTLKFAGPVLYFLIPFISGSFWWCFLISIFSAFSTAQTCVQQQLQNDETAQGGIMFVYGWVIMMAGALSIISYFFLTLTNLMTS